MYLRLTKEVAFTIWILCCCGSPASAQTTDDFFNPDVLHEVRIYMHPHDWATLKQNYLANTYYPADFLWKFQGRYLEVPYVMVRSRGTGSRSDVKPGLRVDVSRDEPGRDFLGLRSIVLRNNTQDASMLRERLGMTLFRRLGIPVPRTAHTRMYVNDVYAGLYLIVESVDEAFLHRNYGEDAGHLYKYDYAAEDPPYYFEYRGADPSLYSPKPFQPETHESDPAAQPIADMVRSINLASDAEFVGAVSEYLDLKSFMSYVAVERFLAEQDGFVGLYGMNNFYLYRFEDRNLSQLIPWDRSEAFKAEPQESIWRFITDVTPDRQNRLMKRAITFPELRAVYLSTLAKCAVIAGGEGGFLLREIEREYSQIREAARDDVNKQEFNRPVSNEDFERAVNFLKDFARRRKKNVLAEVAANLEPAEEHAFAAEARGGVSWETVGIASSPIPGQGLVQASTPVSGLAIIDYRANDLLVAEAAAPAAPRIERGRIYAETDGAVSTSLAVSNPNQDPVIISFYFTDTGGRDYGHGTTMIPAYSQITRYLHEPPFNGSLPIHGTFTFDSSLPVAALAFRSFVNERSESLITALPLIDLSWASMEANTIPFFADGGGWTSDVVLVNPTDRVLKGTLEFLDAEGHGQSAAGSAPAAEGKAGAFPYTLPARTSYVLQSSGNSELFQSGSVRITPEAGLSAPAASVIVSYRSSGIITTEACVNAEVAGTAFRMYTESLGKDGEVGAVATGVALSNPGEETIDVKLEVRDLSGKSSGLSASVTLPPRGQMTRFLSQFDGFHTLPAAFQGTLRISVSQGRSVSATGLRKRFNERGEFIVTATGPSRDEAGSVAKDIFFPFLVDGGGYTTRLVLFPAADAAAVSGTLRLISQGGLPLELAVW